MTSQANSKVRLVRCPKCRLVLGELVGVPIYECGGCGAILEAKKRGKEIQGTGSQAREADPKHKNEAEITSENQESCIDKFPKSIDITTDDSIELLGEINKSGQLYGSDAITCHESGGSAIEARAQTEEEGGKLPLYQYGASEKDEDSENSASNEILSFSEHNEHKSNSLVPQLLNYESESFLSSSKTQRRHSSSENNHDGEKEVSESDLENAAEISLAGIVTGGPGSLEDNCDGAKKECENKLQSTSENPSSDNEDLEKVHARGKSSGVNPISRHEIEGLSLESIKPLEAGRCEISSNQSGTEANYESGHDNEMSGDVSILNKVLYSPRLNHLENDLSVLGYHMYESGGSLLSSPKEVARSGFSSPNYDYEGKNELPLQVVEVDENSESLLVLQSKDAENFLDTAAANSYSSKGISLHNLTPPHQEMQQVESAMVPGFPRVGSDETLENPSHFYALGDLGNTLRSSTYRKYYAYDGSTSSNETETDDQVPDRHCQQLKRSLKEVVPNSTKVLPERSEFIRNRVISKESELQRQLMNSGSSLHGKKHFTAKVSRLHQDELLQRARYRSPVRNRMRNKTDDYHSRALVSGYSSHADHGKRSSSNYGRKDFNALPDIPHELHRVELLRMVYELQDQLKRTQISEGMPSERFLTRPSKGKEHHNENRKNYSDLAYHNYHGKYIRATTWLKNRELSQMVVPEDPTDYIHRVHCLCLRCCSQDQHHSAQLPPHAIYRDYMTNAKQTSRPHHSASSSGHHYATSELSLWSQDMKPDDQWYDKHKEARINHIAKRHFQPKAGGAPIIACYHCFETLQLPAESLLFKRRCHQLKCGACSKVLKFSWENNIHVVRYDLNPENPPPGEISENSRVTKKSNLALAYRGNDRPVTGTEASSDNSQSFSRSYSTGDNFSVTPENFSSTSSSKILKEGVKSNSTRASVYKNRSSVESFKSARSTFMMPDSEHSCSESEVESPLPGSALHKLMGYSSIRRLVFQ